MCKHRVRFVQYVGEGNGKASSRKHWNSYDVRIRSTSRAVFFLKLGCLSGCFDRILLLSASSGYHTLSEGTLRIPAKIFDLRQPAQIHIHIQLRLAGTSLCLHCRLHNRMPRPPNRLVYVSVCRRTTGADCQTLERLAFIEKSKTYILELRCFEVMQPTLFLQNF